MRNVKLPTKYNTQAGAFSGKDMGMWDGIRQQEWQDK